MSSKRNGSKFWVFLIFIIVAFIVIMHTWSPDFTIKGLKEYILSYGNLVPLVLFFVIFITSSIGFVFTIPVAVSALVLGVWPSFFISVLALTLGATVSFYLARYIGRDYVERKFVHRIKKLEHFDEHLKKSGFATILLLRFTTLIPYEVINIVGGLSRITFRSYFFATLIGIMPGTLLTIYLIRKTTDIHDPQFFIAALLMTLFALLPLLSKKIRKAIFNGQ